VLDTLRPTQCNPAGQRPAWHSGSMRPKLYGSGFHAKSSPDLRIGAARQRRKVSAPVFDPCSSRFSFVLAPDHSIGGDVAGSSLASRIPRSLAALPYRVVQMISKIVTPIAMGGDIATTVPGLSARAKITLTIASTT
jgi:hypothetical protein